MTERQAKPENPLVHLLSGASAGMFSDAFVHPIDTIRARMQVQRGNVLYNNMSDAVLKILKHEGWRTFYKGFGIVVTFTIPAHAFYFLGYEAGKRYIQPSKPIQQKGPLVHFLSGLIAEVCGAVVWTPMDIVKQRLQTQSKSSIVQYHNSLHGITSLMRDEGFKGLFRGFGPGVATYAPFVGLYFMFYEQGKVLGTKITGKNPEKLPPIVHLTSGFLSGGIAAALTNPLDVIKTRIQVQSSESVGGYKSGWHGFKTILKEEGPGTFLKGIRPRVLWIAPGTALTIASYEQFKKLASFVID
eukprot:TRINITY_DN2825_c0_g1_i1.p1 TRINITY_DN2825_c0_g1~~TRINITY_DN2825_c0_g1_i1.p1  ORF type:complete len:331 (-),score=43.98 TRINITY_DN2825_c0_g1_i1:44-943(-)